MPQTQTSGSMRGGGGGRKKTALADPGDRGFSGRGWGVGATGHGDFYGGGSHHLSTAQGAHQYADFGEKVPRLVDQAKRSMLQKRTTAYPSQWHT